MSQRKQPPQKLPEVSFEDFMSQLGVTSDRFSGEHENIANGPAPDPDALIELDQLPGKGPIQIAQEEIDAALLHQAQAPVGYPLNQALAKSPYLRLAARLLLTKPNIVVVSNGFRYWTADLASFEPMLAEFNPSKQLNYEDWQPVYGDDRGLYMGARREH